MCCSMPFSRYAALKNCLPFKVGRGGASADLWGPLLFFAMTKIVCGLPVFSLSGKAEKLHGLILFSIIRQYFVDMPDFVCQAKQVFHTNLIFAFIPAVYIGFL